MKVWRSVQRLLLGREGVTLNFTWSKKLHLMRNVPLFGLASETRSQSCRVEAAEPEQSCKNLCWGGGACAWGDKRELSGPINTKRHTLPWKLPLKNRRSAKVSQKFRNSDLREMDNCKDLILLTINRKLDQFSNFEAPYQFQTRITVHCCSK